MSDHPQMDEVLVENDQLDRELQPHLGDNHDNNTAALEYINPVLDATDIEPDSAKNYDSSKPKETVQVTTNVKESTSSGQNGGQVTSATPVVYDARNGESNVIREPVVIRQPNGVHVIRTRACCDNVYDGNRVRNHDRPLKLKRIKLMKAFSVVAFILFFPLGIPAMYYAFKCEKEFHAGILRGNIDMAQKLANRSEKLIIFSVMGALLVAVSVFAIVERNLMGHDEKYWEQRSHSGAFPTG